MEVPRYGIHDGIKYSPRRTLIRICIICGNPYVPSGRRSKVCGDECRDIKNKKHNEKWNPINNNNNNKVSKEKRKEYNDRFHEKNPNYRKEWIRNNKNKNPAKWKEYNKKYYKKHPDKINDNLSRLQFTKIIKEINDWEEYHIHHIYPVGLLPSLSHEEWNLIPLSPELHKEFHKQTGGYKNASNWNINWIEEIINFIYKEVYNK